jgi:uncharacterized protein YggU (UPF0235/DUF167 family)
VKIGSAITAHVIYGASRNAIDEVQEDGTVVIRMKALQAEHKANQALVDFLAEVLRVDPAQIEIIGGASGSDKLITITDLDKNVVQTRIYEQIR